MKAYVKESQYRKKHHGKIPRRKQQRTAPTVASPPKNYQATHCQNGRRVGTPLECRNAPFRIDHAQMDRPKCLVDVKPKCVSGTGHAREKTVRLARKAAHDQSAMMVDPHRRHPQDQRCPEKRPHTQDVFRSHAPMQPPHATQQHEWRHDHCRLAQESQHKRRQGKPVPAPRALFVEFQIQQDRHRVKKH